MRGLRSRLAWVQRRLRPAGLVAEWYDVLAHINGRWALGRGEAELWEEARSCGATGRHPGDVLAEALGTTQGDLRGLLR